MIWTILFWDEWPEHINNTVSYLGVAGFYYFLSHFLFRPQSEKYLCVFRFILESYYLPNLTIEVVIIRPGSGS